MQPVLTHKPAGDTFQKKKKKSPKSPSIKKQEQGDKKNKDITL